MNLKEPQFASELIGMFRIVTTPPTHTPKNFLDQIVFYVDSLTSPTVFTMYVFFPTINEWRNIEGLVEHSVSPSKSPSVSPSTSPS